MTLLDLKSEIVGNKLSSFYIFTGDEIGIINIYLNQIAKVKSLDIMRLETVAEAWGRASVRGMFADAPHIYVVRGDKDFQKEEKYWDSIVSGLGKNMLILLYDKIDSRLKFGKHFKDKIVPFEKLDKPVLEKYIMQKLPKLKREYASILADICDGSYDVSMLECEKIQTYGGDNNRTLKKLVEDGTIYQSQETDVFQFVDAVCRRKNEDAFDMSARLISDGSSSINLLGALYNALKAIMLIQCCDGDIARTTGLDNGAIYFNKKRTGYYSVPELVRAVKMTSHIISDIKLGIMDDALATDYILINIL